MLMTETSILSPSCLVPWVSSAWIWVREQKLAQNLVLMVSPLGTCLMSSSVARKLRVLNPKSGEEILTFPDFLTSDTTPLYQSAPDLKRINCPMARPGEHSGIFSAFSARYWR